MRHTTIQYQKSYIFDLPSHIHYATVYSPPLQAVGGKVSMMGFIP